MTQTLLKMAGLDRTTVLALHTYPASQINAIKAVLEI
jgi:hypothetical protein